MGCAKYRIPSQALQRATWELNTGKRNQQRPQEGQEQHTDADPEPMAGACLEQPRAGDTEPVVGAPTSFLDAVGDAELLVCYEP